MSLALVWFRRDLRLADNPALEAARKAHDRVLPVYVYAPDEEAPWQPGAASRWWLHHSLAALDAALRKHDAVLHVRRGDTLGTLRALVAETGADAVYWNRLYEPAPVARDARIKQALRTDGVDAKSFDAALLFEPWELATGNGSPYKVFTPFWRAARARLEVRPPSAAPRKLDVAKARRGERIESLGLLPEIRWDKGFHRAWEPGEAGAQKALRRFVDDAIADYPQRRDFPGGAGTSRLSPRLHFGEISPMQIAWAIDEASRASRSAKRREGSEAYLRELGWREFSHYLLYHFPASADSNLNPKFDAFPWAGRSPAQIERWQRGDTGFPIVDAGLRELWTTGWMHNRVRMLVASFLTKNLRQHWLEGARWFWDTLVDADLANNTQGWQWTAGTGADAAPYFRIFNPVTQGERFDPDGDYVRRWVPELKAFAGKSIHQPWSDPRRLRNVRYPQPMVDVHATREAALAAYKACK
ncbi:MAG TPA: deoxyribodipyrimidine photo-lyase [Rhodanobacteraceae bacterium]|nr:deoxyribodipyrimidine photo-lyase [Rhodanobacteraceae bacterium]